MTTLTSEKPVIQERQTVSFDILLCKINVIISKKFNAATYKVYFRLRKIRDGNNSWTFTSHFSNENCELISVQNLENENLKTEKVIRDDSKVCYDILLGDLKVHDEIEFILKYKEKLLATKLSNYDVLFNRYFISIIKIFPNHCKLLKIDVEFENPKTSIIASYPANANKINKITFENKDISPYEHSSISFIAFTGLLINKNAVIIEKLMWSIVSGVIGLIIGLLIKIFENGN